MKLTALLTLLVLAFTASASAAASKKVLLILTNKATLGDGTTPSGIHFNELTHPYFAFTQAGYEVDFASPKGGVSPVDPATLDQNDPANRRFWTAPGLRYKLNHTAPVSMVKARDYSAIYLVGGVSTMWDFPNNPVLERLIAEFYDQGSMVGAVCHGPAALVNVRLKNGRYLVRGKKISSFTNEEEVARKRDTVVPFLLETRLISNGATFTKSAPFKYHVVRDGRLVTGQNPASAYGVALEMISNMGLQN